MRSRVQRTAINCTHQNACRKIRGREQRRLRRPEPSRRFQAFRRTSERYEHWGQRVLYVAVSASHVTLSCDCGKISVVYSSVDHINATWLSSPILSCNKGQYTQWVHCELIVGSETTRPAHTQQVKSGHFQKVPTNLPSKIPSR